MNDKINDINTLLVPRAPLAAYPQSAAFLENQMNLKFRKKPVVIEAFQMTEDRRASNADWPDWMHLAWQLDREAPGSLYPTEEGTGDGTLSIGTLEGQHLVSWGDWIIQGVKGELYPCKPDIFEATYAPKTAPVALPKPVGWFHRHPKECKNGQVYNYQIASGDRKDGWEESPVYTEQQVHALLAEVSAPAAQEMDAQLVAFIENVRDFKAQAVRVGTKEGEIRWDIEFGHYGAELRGKTLREVISKALAAQAKQGGAA